MRSKKTKATTEIIESTTTISNEISSPGQKNPTAVNEETGLDENTRAASEISSQNGETGLDENTPPVNGILSTELDENTSPVNGILSTELDENTPPVNGILSTELDEITPYLNREIPPQLVQEIIDELRADRDLHEYCLNMFPGDDVEMFEEESSEGELY